jgi:hypothetical protein
MSAMWCYFMYYVRCFHCQNVISNMKCYEIIGAGMCQHSTRGLYKKTHTLHIYEIIGACMCQHSMHGLYKNTHTHTLHIYEIIGAGMCQHSTRSLYKNTHTHTIEDQEENPCILLPLDLHEGLHSSHQAAEVANQSLLGKKVELDRIHICYWANVSL